MFCVDLQERVEPLHLPNVFFLYVPNTCYTHISSRTHTEECIMTNHTPTGVPKCNSTHVHLHMHTVPKHIEGKKNTGWRERETGRGIFL